MRLLVTHSTQYQFDKPIDYALQQIRLTPVSTDFQNIISWDLDIIGASKELTYSDQFRNVVNLLNIESGVNEVIISCYGEVETTDKDGIVGAHQSNVPLWLYKRQTILTKAGINIKRIAKEINNENAIESVHKVCELILSTVKYKLDNTDANTTAEDAMKLGVGVCQDHAHILISAARLAGFPARYVSGYIFIDGEEQHSANHAWAEIYFEGIGWIGFDVSNGISPDERYIRVAIGLDASDTAPVKGIRYGEHQENLEVIVNVQQQ